MNSRHLAQQWPLWLGAFCGPKGPIGNPYVFYP
jgi:hypothetical protein